MSRARPGGTVLTAVSVAGAWIVVAATVVYLGCTTPGVDSEYDLGIRLPDSVTGRVFGLGIAVVGIAVRMLRLSARL